MGGKSTDGWRQALVAIIAFVHAVLYFVMFCAYDFQSYEGPRAFIILCVPEIVTSFILILAALKKNNTLFVPWILTTTAMLVTMLMYVLKALGSGTNVFITTVMFFSLFSMGPVCLVGSCFSRISARSLSPPCATESNPLNNQNNRTTAPSLTEDSLNVTAHGTAESYPLNSRHNRPTAPPFVEPESTAVSVVNTTANIADEPPAYDEAVAKLPYPPYPVVGPRAANNPPYPVAGLSVAAYPPYPITAPVGLSNRPYPPAASVAAPNPPYPLGDPVGAPTPQHFVADSTSNAIVGWRTNLFSDNPTM